MNVKPLAVLLIGVLAAAANAQSGDDSEFVVVRTDASPSEVVDNESPWWDAH